MRRCRFLPLLILVCALDLAMPVAPTPAGIEFEEDEEVLHQGGWRLPRLGEATGHHDVAPTPRTTSERAVMAAASRIAAMPRPAYRPRLRLTADRSFAPSAPGEDH